MLSHWDKYGRLSLDFASAATSIGFSAAKVCTKLGFSVTRGIASTAAGFTGTVIDHTLFGGSTGAGALFGGAVSSAISAVEFVALAPILLGETLTSTSFVAANSSLSILTTIFPGSDEASFSLASFVGLVRREWNEPAESEGLPEERYGLGEVLKALAGFGALQGVTSEWQENRWFKYMKEVPVYDEAHVEHHRQRVDSRVTITGDKLYASHTGQIVTADITEIPVPGSWPNPRQTPSHPVHISSTSRRPVATASVDELKQTLRRFSKLVLAGYGGASLLFFGVSPSPSEQRKEEMKIADAIDASEREAAGPRGPEHTTSAPPPAPDADGSGPGSASYSWWNVLMGKHDHDIFLNWAKTHSPPGTPAEAMPPTAHVGSENLMPRFWVLSDHVRKEVVLVIRGTMSLNELAVDLTCEPVPFSLPRVDRTTSKSPSHSSPLVQPPQSVPEEVFDELDETIENIPGGFPFPMGLSVPFPRTRKDPEQVGQSSKPFPRARVPSESADDATYIVHGGMLKMARAMGGPGKPVHVAVRDALKRNKGYSLVLCGHSLGAGVAGLLALMWAAPETRLTHRASGLPIKRQVTAYCFAPPCIVSPRLGARAATSGLITSFVYGHDIVSRLSLGSVRDLTRAAVWLCAAENKEGSGDGYSSVTKKAMKWKMGRGDEGDEEWFLAIRKTLEANMQMADLFPPGRVFWAVRDGDLNRAHRLGAGSGQPSPKDKVRLFEIMDVKQVFGQIIFARDMLSSHLPHQYDKVLHELL
ncbi:alpha/beta-hydrolase [Trametes gibbosa]|nr:alpha/beta-hydrolase [Trametes gibbosa]